MLRLSNTCRPRAKSKVVITHFTSTSYFMNPWGVIGMATTTRLRPPSTLDDPTPLNDGAYDCINQACIPTFDEPSPAFGTIAQYTNDCMIYDSGSSRQYSKYVHRALQIGISCECTMTLGSLLQLLIMTTTINMRFRGPFQHFWFALGTSEGDGYSLDGHPCERSNHRRCHGRGVSNS